MNRPLPERGKMRSIEASRAFAAIAVVLMHAANLMRVEHFSGHIGMGQVFDFGYVGVDFFFVLSGFIITYIHHAEIGHFERIPRYLWRRFSRIFPIYWVILLLSIGVISAGRLATGKAVGFEIGLSDIAGTIFLVMGEGEPKYLGVAWSLQYEVIFYLAFCLLLINARMGVCIFFAWALFVLVRAFGLTSLDLPLQLGSAHCLQFLLGVVVGMVTRRYRLHVSKKTLLAALGLLAVAVVFEVYGPFARHSAQGRMALGLASAAVLATLVFLENEDGIRTPKWLARMGSVSYSIYLGHIVFINLSYSILLKLGVYHSLPEGVVYATAIGMALGATFAIGIFVELPLVSLLKDRFGSGFEGARIAAGRR
jgi:peptidoglycan/LPS O-acetylase OafA/YrhL